MHQLTLRALETKEENGDATTTVIASTDSPDRADDIVDQSWKLDRFKANPVIQWAHRYDMPPVGKATSIEVRDGQLTATIKWDTGSELGANVARQYREGFLSAVSVGFRPGEAVHRSGLADTDPRKGKSGHVFRNNELLEISAVPVPMNSDALATRGLPALGMPGQESLLKAPAPSLTEDDIRRIVREEIATGQSSEEDDDGSAGESKSWFDAWGSK